MTPGLPGSQSIIIFIQIPQSTPINTSPHKQKTKYITRNFKMEATTEARCAHVQIFFRLCGHVEYSHKHTATCTRATNNHVGHDAHWNPLLYNVKPLYVVGNCQICLNRLQYPGHLRAREPANNVSRGTEVLTANTTIRYRPNQLREIALPWRFMVEEDERVSRFGEQRRERKLIASRAVRELRWNNAWAQHCANNVGDSRAKILDLTNDLSRQRTADNLLASYQAEAGEECIICLDSLSNAPGDDPNEAPKPVKFTCGCDHNKAHYKCVLSLLLGRGQRDCPHCRLPWKFVVKNTNEDPVFTWVQADLMLYQVRGYIDFRDGLVNPIENPGPGQRYFPQDDDSVEFRKKFQPFVGEDRWGDIYGDSVFVPPPPPAPFLGHEP